MDQQTLVRWINELIEEDKLYKFYKSREFRELRTKVLDEAHHECQYCRAKGKISLATIAHHEYYVRDYPQYALSQYVSDKEGKHRNLVAVCHKCHEEVHANERLYGWLKKKQEDKTNTEPEERWD